MGSLETLYASEDVRVTAHHRPTQTVMISFGWSRRDVEIRFGAAFVERFEQFAGIFFAVRNANVSQAPQIIEALASIRHAAARYDRRVVIGASAGGFGALLLGAQLDPESIIAISPLTTLSDPAAGIRKARVLPPKYDDVPAALGDVKPTLIFDPFHLADSRQAAWLAARHPVKEIHTPLSGHTPLRVLRRAGLFNTSLRCVMNGCDPVEFTRLYERARAAQPSLIEAAQA
jgi:hypothetical protein